MLGSVTGLAMEVGEPEEVDRAAVDVGEELAVLEREALGLLSPPHPASNMDAASGTARSAAEVLLTALPTSSFPTSLHSNFLVSNGAANRTRARRRSEMLRMIR